MPMVGGQKASGVQDGAGNESLGEPLGLPHCPTFPKCLQGCNLLSMAGTGCGKLSKHTIKANPTQYCLSEAHPYFHGNSLTLPECYSCFSPSHLPLHGAQ